MFCENCGKMLEEGTKFCSGCGRPVKEKQPANNAQAYAASNNAASNNDAQSSTTPNNGAPGNGTPNNGAGGNGGYGYADNRSANFGNAQPYGYQYAPAPENPLIRLSKKVKTNAIIWTVIASLQAVIAAVNFYFWLDGLRWWPDEVLANGISALMLAVIATLNFVSSAKDFKYSKNVLNVPRGIVAKFQPIGGYIANLIYNIIFGGLVGIVGSIYGLCVRSYVMNNAGYFQMVERQYMENTQQNGF